MVLDENHVVGGGVSDDALGLGIPFERRASETRRNVRKVAYRRGTVAGLDGARWLAVFVDCPRALPMPNVPQPEQIAAKAPIPKNSFLVFFMATSCILQAPEMSQENPFSSSFREFRFFSHGMDWSFA